VKLIVGLGNPGTAYGNTRHNAGFRVVDALAEDAGAKRWRAECQSLVCAAEIEGRPALLAKPLTFMNLSGHAVRLLLNEYRLEHTDLVVVVDDYSLPLGKIRVRERGSSGGHNGLESIFRALESDEFVRVRLGIGEEEMPEDKARFVLSAFPTEREGEVQEMIFRAMRAVQAVLRVGATQAMSLFNA
jgi:PTH1 family peptidyl-tRNA hydrolase